MLRPKAYWWQMLLGGIIGTLILVLSFTLGPSEPASKTEIQKLKASVEGTVGQIEVFQKSTLELADNVKKTSGQVTSLTSAVGSLQSSVAQLAAQQPAELAKKVDTLTASVSTALIEVENNKKVLTEFQNSLSGLKAEVAQQVKSALEGMPSAAQVQNQFEQLTAKLSAEVQREQDLAQKLNTALSEIAGLEDQLHRSAAFESLFLSSIVRDNVRHSVGVCELQGPFIAVKYGEAIPPPLSLQEIKMLDQNGDGIVCVVSFFASFVPGKQLNQ